jgi:hypothetical protein
MRIGTAVTVLLAAASSLQAQNYPLPFGDLEPGQAVRVKTVGGSRFVTRLGHAPRDSVAGLFARAETPFQAERVDSLWVRGHAVGTGALVGAVVATPLAFAFWWWVCDAVSEGSGCSSWGTVTGLALAGGAGGALVGAGIGAVVPKWRLRYARGRDALIRPRVAPGRVGVTIHF